MIPQGKVGTTEISRRNKMSLQHEQINCVLGKYNSNIVTKIIYNKLL